MSNRVAESGELDCFHVQKLKKGKKVGGQKIAMHNNKAKVREGERKREREIQKGLKR